MTTTAEGRVFALIRALEVDGRTLIERFLEPTLGLTEILSPFASKINKRLGDQEASAKLLDYLDFGDIFEIFNANRSSFPSDISADLETIRASTTRVVRIRNTVMHGRSLKEDDEESLQNIARGLQSPFWQNLQNTLKSLQSNESDQVFEVQPDNSSVLHNLPRPDHNDTSLIGRRSEVEEVSKLLLQNRSSVITITGPGGIGKTALALEVAYGFVEKENPFELILWATFKNEKLTVDGIQEIADATKTFPELTHLFADVIGATLDDTSSSLGKALDGINTLICLDNLETITGTDFIDFYNSMPDSCKFLITSRRGIGQIERRFDLQPIKKRDAVHFIHQLIRNLRVLELQRASTESIEAIVDRYGNNPLAIKWFVQSVSSGISILEIFKYREKEFFEFCVGSVVQRLSSSTKNVLFALKHLNRFVSIEELLLLTDFEEQELAEAIRDLQMASLIQSRIVGTEIRQQVQLTESAQKYIREFEVRDEAFLETLRKQESRIRQDETDRQKDLQSPYSPYAIAIRNEEDIPIATMLRKAIRESRSENAKALELINSARRLAPDYWEVDKTEAMIRYWMKDTNPIVDLYSSALEKAPNIEKKSIIYFLYAGFFARQGLGKQALELLENIPEELVQENVLALRGDCRLRIGQIDLGLEDLRSSIISTDPKTVIVNKTRLIKGYERIAEQILDREKNFSKAFDNLQLGFEIFSEIYESKIRDFKLLEGYAGLLYVGIKILDKSINMGETQYKESLDRFENLLRYSSALMTNNRHGTAIRAAFRRQSSLSEEFRIRIEKLGIDLSAEVSEEGNSSVVYTGEVLSWNEQKKFGFISSNLYPVNVYFNENSLFPGQDIDDYKNGTQVSFEIDLKFIPRTGGSPRAQFVQRSFN